MTQLALVKNNTVVEPPAEPLAKYSTSERELIEQYQAKLALGRYFKYHTGSHPFARILSGDSPTEPLSMAFLVDDFVDFCREHGRPVPSPLPSAPYLAYGLETVTGTIFKPKGTSLIRSKYSRHKYVNTFKEFVPEHPPLPLSPHFHKLWECLFPDPVERHTMLQYIAHAIQFPEIRPSWHPMWLSVTGSGKGFVFNSILTPLFSGQTRLLKKYSELTGRFANVMEGTILIQLDDCKSKRTDVQTQLKSLMSEERVMVEEKNMAAGMVSTYTRIILASNEQVPLDIDDTDRRWYVPKRMEYSDGLTGDEGRKERKKNVIQPLADWLKLDGSLEAMYEFFINYPLDGFDPKTPPMTATLCEQIAKSITVEQTFTVEFLASHETKVVKSEELSKAFSEAGMNKPSNQAIGKLFEFADYRQESLVFGGRKSRYWMPAAMTKAEAESIIDAQPAF
jgi:hypothetical protein